MEDTFDITLTYEVYCASGGSIRATAKTLGLARSTVRRRLEKAANILGVDIGKPLSGGEIKGLKEVKRPLPNKNQIKRYIISSAQNNTKVHKVFWNNLKIYANYLEAEILISQFSYNKASYGTKAVKVNTGPTSEDLKPLWYDPELEPYFCNDRVLLAPTLVFCGEINILPTAARPLSGFENYAGPKVSGIFPHSKLALESIPALLPDDVKINYTTGTVTLKNYVQKKAGLKGEFHHAYSALLVEVNSNGEWWVRQLNSDENGSFYDLDRYINAGTVTTGHRVEAINWGDIHRDNIDPDVSLLNWGEGGILDTLKPKYQFMHDTLDFYSRNHHERGNPHNMFKRWVSGRDCVKSEIERMFTFLDKESNRDWCETVVVDSNHDNALEKWLREADYKNDPTNALFFLECQLIKYKAIHNKQDHFHLLESILKDMGLRDNVRFLGHSDSFIISGGIECGLHGHLGPNGSRGTALSISKMGRKANIGHFHYAAILDGTYVAGTSAKLRPDYSKGPSSHNHSHIITYPNGKRSIITIRWGKYRA